MPPLRITSLTLYTAQFSGCSSRVLTALLLKFPPSTSTPPTFSITHHSISVSNNEHQSPAYTDINPNRSIPTLVVSYIPEISIPSSTIRGFKPSIASLLYESEKAAEKEEKTEERHPMEKQLTITQSPAILSFIESQFPFPQLLPGPEEPVARARVLELASLVACDIQPPGTTRIRSKVREDYGGDGEEWARWAYRRGFGVYESLVARAWKEAERGEKVELGDGRVKSQGERRRFSVGNDVTWADIYLVPAVQGALRIGMESEMGQWPRVKGIVERCWGLKAFRDGGVGRHGRLIP